MTWKLALKHIILFLFGGIIYILIELWWRGHSHITMFFLDGICFLILGWINEFFSWEMGIVWQTLIGAVLVTIIEFIFGVILNIWLGLGIWDYSRKPYNILGQVCLKYFLLWLGLSLVAIFVDDLIRWILFKEGRPRYRLFHFTLKRNNWNTLKNFKTVKAIQSRRNLRK